MSEEAPSPKQPSRLRQFWNRRSRKGRAAIIVGILFAIFLAIGALAPAEEETPPVVEAVEDEAEAAPEATTTEEEEEAKTEEAQEEEPEQVAPSPLLIARVIDGDTLDLDNGERVRLVQIDAPETSGECYAQKSTQALRTLLPAGTEVRIVRDRRLDNRDQYGRLLRYIVKGKQNINVELVRRGAASVWFYRGERGRHATRLARAAEQARAKKRGAWGACQASYDFLAAWTTIPKPPKVAPPETSPNCDPSYPDVCIPPYDQVGDLDCGDVPQFSNFRVRPPDPHGFDGNDNDGYGCESN